MRITPPFRVPAWSRRSPESVSWVVARSLGICLGLAVSTAVAAPVHGTVHFPEDPAPVRRGYFRVPGGALPLLPPVHDPRADALVVLLGQGIVTGDQAAAEAEPDKREDRRKTELRVLGARMNPAAGVISAGGTAVIHNVDPRPVSLVCVHCPAPLPGLPKEPIPAGGKISLTPSRPGEYHLRSPEIPHLQGAVVVVDRAYVGRVEASGSYALDAPEGRYQARLLMNGVWMDQKDVEVGPKGLTLDLRADRGDRAAPGPAPRSAAAPAPADAGVAARGDKAQEADGPHQP